MIEQWPILSIIIFLPLFGAFLIFISEDDSYIARRKIRNVAFLTTLVVFILSLVLWVNFDNKDAGFQMQENMNWLAAGISYHIGVDGISLLFIVLSAFLIPFCILASWKSVTEQFKEYMIAFLILETMLIGVFCALNALLFYIFFEASLIPIFIIIGVWGGGNRVYASLKFFLYTLLGSLLMLIAIMAMYWEVGSLDIPTLLNYPFSCYMQNWLWLAFFASFSIKTPMWPLHTWLPDAHVEAPTTGSVVLAGILLKLGGYGFLRFSLPMFPIASANFAPLIFVLSAVAIVYTSLVAFCQKDMKRLVAYSSIAHMGYSTMGIFAENIQSIEGAIVQMLSHGIVSSALFLCIGVLYDRVHTREIIAFSGLAKNMPKYATVFFIFTMANIGFPGTSGFLGEFLTAIGVFQGNSFAAIVATSGIIFSAIYSLYLYRRVIFGTIDKENLQALTDLSFREKCILYPMILLTVVFGIYPAPVLNVLHSSVELLVNHCNNATRMVFLRW
ncbi:MAG: NADH-quinone oxidoreductase subunit M [Candidatus Tokpelaia sp. JSC161]|jgi:NADH-quinone oxidoreductase subunit M|nr:MAG: NADH-quinone oxidoreductase subunit M [Candidatus Tokpelaia sp. JSC161]